MPQDWRKTPQRPRTKNQQHPKPYVNEAMTRIVKRLARNGGQDMELARAVLQGLRTGYLPLAQIELGTGMERRGYSLEFGEWLSLFRWCYPAAAPEFEVAGEDLTGAVFELGEGDEMVRRIV